MSCQPAGSAVYSGAPCYISIDPITNNHIITLSDGSVFKALSIADLLADASSADTPTIPRSMALVSVEDPARDAIVRPIHQKMNKLFDEFVSDKITGKQIAKKLIRSAYKRVRNPSISKRKAIPNLAEKIKSMNLEDL